MRGKITFVVGAAVGYVLGTRAGRERYEQIKRGAQWVWNTDPVQRGVGAMQGAAQGKIDDLKISLVRAGKEAYVVFARTSERQAGVSRETDAASGQTHASGTEQPGSGS